MSKLSLKMKLGLGFGSLLAVLIITSAISYYSIRKLSDLSAFVDKKAQGRFYSTSIASLINSQKAEYRAFLLTNNEEEMARYAENNAKLMENFDKLEATLSTQQGHEAVAHLRQTLDTYHQIIDRVVQMHRGGQDKEGIALMIAPQSDAVRADLEKTAAELLALQARLKDTARQEESATESSAILLLLGLAVGGVVTGVTIAILTIRAIRRPITAMSSLIQQVAANDLAVQDIEIESEDEIGSAGMALNQMKNNLRQMIQSIAGTAEHVAAASEEISSTATQQAQSAETQKNQTTQVATAMQQMSSTVLQVSENSNKAAESSRQAAETARRGGGIVDETLSKMQVIAQSVAGTAKKMDELGKSSDQIGRIIGVIDDIADQTNLLALNAAIEAARAGEQGRGFAVVADEVRKLAERTTTATKEIAQMIKSIQDETKTAVAAMEAGTRQVEDGVKSTAQAGDTLKEIIHTSEQVGEMIMHIATAATEQSSASEEINGNMEQIAKLVKESAVGTQQSAKACQDLSGLALDLQNMVSNFKLDQGSGSGHRQAGGVKGQDPVARPKTMAAAAGQLNA